jgi:sugar lactone lactonase YvrE
MINIFNGTKVRAVGACLFTVALHAQVANSKIETVATLPAPGNTENIAQGQDGAFYITSLSERILWKVSSTGTVEKFFSEPSRSAFVGVAANKNEIVLGVFQRPYLRPNTGGQPGGRAQLDMSNVGSQILVLDKKGKLKATIDGQTGQFFNGIALAKDGVYLITDTAGTTVLRLDTASKKIEPWIKDDLLARQNGIKVHNGWVYIACIDKIYRVQMDSNIKPKGGPILFAQGVPTDDFAVAPDGTLYISSGTTMMKVSPTGEVSKFLDNAPNGAASWVTKDGKWLYWPTRLGDAPQRLLLRAALK